MVEPLLMERRASYIASETKLLTNIGYICIVSALLTINKRIKFFLDYFDLG